MDLSYPPFETIGPDGQPAGVYVEIAQALAALLAPLQTGSWALALRPGDKELLTQVNAFLAQFRTDGGFDRLADRYLVEEKAAFEAEAILFVFQLPR